MKTLFAVMLATSLVVAPAAFAQDAMKPAMKDSKLKKTDKMDKKTGAMSKTSSKKKPDNMMDRKDPMITKDEMTR